MLDLGASINVMTYFIYDFLKLGPLNKIGVVIQLVDRSNTYPKGLVEDVLVQVNDLVFPADFYVLDMGNNDENAPIVLGRPFLKTSKTKIDVHSGILTLEFDGKTIKFNIYDDMKNMCEDNHVYSIDVTDSLALNVFQLDGKNELEVVISKHVEKVDDALTLSADLLETVVEFNDASMLQHSAKVSFIALPHSNKKPLPSMLQLPNPDLKSLLSLIKYVFPRDNETLLENKLESRDPGYIELHLVEPTTINKGAAWETTQGEFFPFIFVFKLVCFGCFTYSLHLALH
ncbi:hypothetical protein PTKIN_Ptkin17bG0079300 [Pterospermum kingtungense]